MTAIWTTPRTWSVGELTTAALMNQHMRDNFDWLRTPPQAVVDISATVALSTTTYADILTLASITPTGNPLLFTLEAAASCSAAIGASQLTFDITEDGTSIFSAANMLPFSSIGAGLFFNVSFGLYVAGRSAAAHVYKLRGKISAGTANIYGSGAGFNGRFAVREI